MTAKQKVRSGTDLCMLLLLPVLMAYSLVGEAAHEWLGTALFSLFLLHHGLNRRWYKTIFKGRYTAARALETAADLLMTAGMLLLAGSGVLMSEHVFAFLGLHGGMAFARITHLLCSYWMFVLMGVHAGFHGGRLAGAIKSAAARRLPMAARGALPRIGALALAGYGAYAFLHRRIGTYLLLRTQFVFFDSGEPVIFFLADYFSVFCLFALAAYEVKKGLLGLQKRKSGDKPQGGTENGKVEIE